MFYVEFNYNEFIRKVECDYQETMRSICKRYCKKTILDINTLHFMYLGKEIDLELTFSQTAAGVDKERKIMTIMVFDKDMGDLHIVRANEVICYTCYGSALLSIEKYRIRIHDCMNGHKVGSFLLDEIEENQSIDLSQIKCGHCKIYSRGYTYKNEFYRCNTCKINLCPMCEPKHDKDHVIIDYDRRNFVCEEHKRSYHSFCTNCKKNMCVLCEKKHGEHKILYLHKMFLHTKDELLEKLNELKKSVNKFVKDVKMIISKLNLIKENMKCFYELIYHLIHAYDEKNINFEVLKNIHEIATNTEIQETLDLVNNETDIYSKFKLVYDLYEDMIYKNDINIIYQVNKLKDTLKIFGEEFVDNNDTKCTIILEGEEQELQSEIDIKDILKDKIRVKLTNLDQITHMSNIFCNCSDLYSCNDMSKWRTNNVKDMQKIFYGCSRLTSLPDLSFWHTQNVKDFCGMFYNCVSIISIPDISEWVTSKVKNMSGMFCGCERLKYLPDISRWDTRNVNDMNGLFCGCTSLEYIPKINRWSTDKVKDMSGIFCGCSNLLKLPDISDWNIDKVKSLDGMFFSCSKLKSIPDISIWNTENVKNMTGMFGNCFCLTSLPDINKWTISKKTKIANMFRGCKDELNIPEKFRHTEDDNEDYKNNFH